MELCEIPGQGPGKAEGKGERGENALPEEWGETKIRVCCHQLSEESKPCVSAVLTWATSEIRVANGLQETVVTAEEFQRTRDGQQITEDKRRDVDALGAVSPSKSGPQVDVFTQSVFLLLVCDKINSKMEIIFSRDFYNLVLL